jgi:hypothetical protein
VKAEERLVHPHFLLKLGSLRFQSRQGRGAVDRMRRTALPTGRLRAAVDTGHFGQLTRLIFDRVDAVVKILQLLPLFVIFCAQPLILTFNPQVFCLLGQPVKPIKQPAQQDEKSDG